MSLIETGRMTDMSETLNGWMEMPEAELVLIHCSHTRALKRLVSKLNLEEIYL